VHTLLAPIFGAWIAHKKGQGARYFLVLGGTFASQQWLWKRDARRLPLVRNAAGEGEVHHLPRRNGLFDGGAAAATKFNPGRPARDRDIGQSKAPAQALGFFHKVSRRSLVHESFR